MAVKLSSRHALCVVLASEGYPGPYRTGSNVRGVESAGTMPDVTVFHAGTRLEGDRLVSAGGRVLTVCGIGDGLLDALERAYRGVDRIVWPEGFCRRDIGHAGLARMGKA
jgi:phosphoribosylamine--glycine ligase